MQTYHRKAISLKLIGTKDTANNNPNNNNRTVTITLSNKEDRIPPPKQTLEDQSLSCKNTSSKPMLLEKKKTKALQPDDPSREIYGKKPQYQA